MATSRLEIDLGAIDRNIQRVVKLANPAGSANKVALCGVIKQDGYGLGAARLAKRLAGSGVDMLAVYSPDEARALVDIPIKTPVLVLMPVWSMDRADTLYRLAVNSRLHVTLHSLPQAQELANIAARIGLDLPVHVQVDTGMSRGGSLPDEAEALVQFAASAPRFRLAGVMTHFSSPAHDEVFTKEQARLFRAWVDRIKPILAQQAAKGRPPVLVHAANTAATLRSSSLHATMMRIGQGLMGLGAEAVAGEENIEFMTDAAALEPAVRWVSRIAHVEAVPAGWPVGYNRTWEAKRPSLIALVPVGYANGYPLGLSNTGVVRLPGTMWDKVRTTAPDEPIVASSRLGQPGVFAPVVGRVSMDQITIDVTDVPEAMRKPGCEVELVGVDYDAPNHLPTLSKNAGTITYEFLCRIGQGVERTYLTTTVAQPAPSDGPRAIVMPAIAPRATAVAG